MLTGHEGAVSSLAVLADIEVKPAALGYVFVPWFSTGANSARHFR